MGKLFDGSQQMHITIRVFTPGILEIVMANMTFDDLHEIQPVFHIPNLTIKTSLSPLSIPESGMRRLYVPYTCPAESSGTVHVMFLDKSRQSRIIFLDLAVPRATEGALLTESLWQKIYPQLSYHYDIPVDVANIHGYRAGFSAIGLKEVGLGRFVMFSPLACIDLVPTLSLVRVACLTDAALSDLKGQIQRTVDAFGRSHIAKAFRLGREFTTLLDLFELDDMPVATLSRQIANIQEILADLNDTSPQILGRLSEIATIFKGAAVGSRVCDLDLSRRQISMQYLEEMETQFFSYIQH